jgi:arylsulfatase
MANVILFLSDALRPDHLGCYGYKRQTSPFLDSLAKRAALFESAVSCASFTMPSHKAIFSSVYDSGGNLEKVKPNLRVFPEALQEKGVTTAAFVSNGITSKKAGFGKGFDVFDEGFTGREKMAEKGRNALEAVDAAIKWIEKNRAKDFFCFIQVVDTHGPYQPPKEFVEMFKDGLLEEQNRRKLALSETDLGFRAIPKYQQIPGEDRFGQYVARYDAGVRFVDSALERLWQGLEKLGLERKTDLVFTSDHGEAMGEHDWFFCHGIDLYEESIRVPLVVKSAKIGKGLRKEQASHLDIGPTVLELFGLKKLQGMQGESLLKPVSRKELFFEMNSDIHSKVLSSVRSCVRTNEWKYLESSTKRAEGGSAVRSAGRVLAGARKGGISLIRSSFRKARQLVPMMLKPGLSEELYDLSWDQGEKCNLAKKEKNLANSMKKRLGSWRIGHEKVLEKLGKSEKLDPSSQMMKRLRKLGYFE